MYYTVKQATNHALKNRFINKTHSILKYTFLLSLLIFAAFSAQTSSAGMSTGRALSIKVLQKMAEDCMDKMDFNEDVFQMAGLKQISGYVVDHKLGDVILAGKTGGNLPALHLDDFVTALRNAWLKYADFKNNTYYYEAPGCSIDPDDGVFRELKQLGHKIRDCSEEGEKERLRGRWRLVCENPQSVRVMGVPFTSRFANIMVDADYYLKRIVNGSEALNIAGFESLADMTLNEMKINFAKNSSDLTPSHTINRFWFAPGANHYLEKKDSILIKKCDVVLLTEEEFVTSRGKVAGFGIPNQTAKRFADNFSDKYGLIARKREIYRELENLYRFAAIVKLMKMKDAVSKSGLSIDYFLKHFIKQHEDVNKTLKGVSNVKQLKNRTAIKGGYSERTLWITNCGGVSMDIDINNSDIGEDKTGALLSAKNNILEKRPNANALYWDY